ncbi:MAG: glycosyltransferase 87 family protein [Acidobacteriaceae bacterium]|jgi:hypothetical protein|nr:glycosyltransferase 87 family protein [Acidobacteriaceae bacterium]
MPRTRANIALTLALVVHLVTAAISFVLAPQPAGDFDRYYEIASGQGRPYVDFQVEHPIGTFLVFRAIANVTGGRAAFGRAVVTLNLAADAVIMSVIWTTWGLAAVTYYAIVSAPIAGLLFTRIDFWSIMAATIGVAAWRRGRPAIAGAALAIGASLKLWPAVLALLLLDPPARRKAAAGMFIAVGAALGFTALALTGAGSVLEVLTFRGAHGWQIESLVGATIHLFTDLPIRMESGSWRIGDMGNHTSTVLFLASAPICLWAGWRAMRTKRAGAGWLAGVSTLLVLSALLSPQYIGWLIPGGAIAWVEGDRRPAWLTVAVVVLTQLFWMTYQRVMDGVPFAVGLVVLRNLVLIGLAVSALVTLARPRTALLETEL